jgi:hypothetical protein
MRQLPKASALRALAIPSAFACALFAGAGTMAGPGPSHPTAGAISGGLDGRPPPPWSAEWMWIEI